MMLIPWTPIQLVPNHDEMYVQSMRDGTIMLFTSTRCWTRHYCTRCGNQLASRKDPCPICGPPAAADSNSEHEPDMDERKASATQKDRAADFPAPWADGRRWSVHPA